ncbi:MAG TPA: hypothetical protein VF458_05035 [Ktedonobacteraceae bacterium]
MDELHLYLPPRMRRHTLDLPASVLFRADGHIIDLSTRLSFLFFAYTILLSSCLQALERLAHGRRRDSLIMCLPIKTMQAAERSILPRPSPGTERSSDDGKQAKFGMLSVSFAN